MSTSGICDTGRTRLDYADVRPACTIPPHHQGLGNVQQTAIGLVRDGQLITGTLPSGHVRGKCVPVQRKPAGPVC